MDLQETPIDSFPSASIAPKATGRLKEPIPLVVPATVQVLSPPPTGQQFSDIAPRSIVSFAHVAERAPGLDGDDDDDWEAELFGADTDAPETHHVFSEHAEHSVVCPDREKAHPPNKAPGSRVSTLDCAMPIIALPCDLYVLEFISLGDIGLILTIPFSIFDSACATTTALNNSAVEPEEKCEVNDNVPPERTDDDVDECRNKLKLGHAVEAPTSTHTPLPPMAKSSAHGSTTSTSPLSRRVSRQNMKRKRTDDKEHRDLSSESEDEVPLARVLVRMAKKPRAEASTAILRAVVHPPSPASNAF